MNRILNAFRAWVPLAVITTAFCLLAYLMVQQVLRQGANDPQIQMAEDSAAALDHSGSLETVIPKQEIEIESSLAPFLLVYDENGRPQAGSGMLNGVLPDYPLGALQSSRVGGENRVTWQPSGGIRIASVVVPYQHGYVVAGRSLREVENRDSQAQLLAGAAWIFTMLAAFVAAAIFAK